MSANVINFIAIAAGGLLAVPSIASLFATPPPENTIMVKIGVGDVNSSEPVPNGQTLSGFAPGVTLYDINGREIGSVFDKVNIVDGGALQIKITGDGGEASSRVPVYIKLEASDEDPICVSWLTTTSSTSSNADFRSWNAGTARACGIPWYPSVAPFGGVPTLFQPPCFWLSRSGEFVTGMSTRLNDFFFPGPTTAATNMATQWRDHRDTLCDAPGRQQFYKNLGLCIPFYPSGLTVVNEKIPENGFADDGFDVDFDAIKSSHTQTCSIAGIPFNNVDLGDGLPTPPAPIPSEVISSLIETAVLTTKLTLPLFRRQAAAESHTTTSDPIALVTASAEMPEKAKPEIPVQKNKKPPVLERRAEDRHRESGRWCRERHLVITESAAHSAKEVCESETSWGPDMAAVQEGMYCDMCSRTVYSICGSAKSATPGAKNTGTCFDLKTKQLRVQGKVSRRERDSVPAKEYQVVKHWK